MDSELKAIVHAVMRRLMASEWVQYLPSDPSSYKSFVQILYAHVATEGRHHGSFEMMRHRSRPPPNNTLHPLKGDVTIH